MLICTMTTSRILLNIKVRGKGDMGFFVCFLRMILLEPVRLDSPIVLMSFARWRQFVHESDWRYLRAVLRLEQGLTILFLIVVKCICLF